MFRCTYNKGFQIQFDNGWEVSIQFGIGNYCSNRFFGVKWNSEPKDFYECNDAEVAVIDPKGNFVKLNDSFFDDGIRGWVKADEIPAILAEVQAK